jgi:hypothetical protein
MSDSVPFQVLEAKSISPSLDVGWIQETVGSTEESTEDLFSYVETKGISINL